MAVFEVKTINFFLNKVSQVYKQNKNGQSSVLAMCERGRGQKKKKADAGNFGRNRGMLRVAYLGWKKLNVQGTTKHL